MLDLDELASHFEDRDLGIYAGHIDELVIQAIAELRASRKVVAAARRVVDSPFNVEHEGRFYIATTARDAHELREAVRLVNAMPRSEGE